MKNLKNVLIVGAAVLLTAGAVGGVAYLTKGFTTADPISDLTKRGEVVQILEKTVDPLTHIATYSIPVADLPAEDAGTFSVSEQLDAEEEYLLNGVDAPGDVIDLSAFSAAQAEKIADQANGAGNINFATLWANAGYSIHEWEDATSEADTKLEAFDTVRINFSLSKSVMLVSNGYKLEDSDQTSPTKAFSKVETLTPLQTYIDIDHSEIGTTGSMDNMAFVLVGLNGDAIPDVEIKSIELVNKACAYDFISYVEM